MRLKNIYFILRHGENNFQVKHKDFVYYWPDIPPVRLTRNGKEQVKEAARKLKKIGIGLIYSSDIHRCKQTTEIVAKELGINRIIFDKRLRDINLGIFHGRTKKEFLEFVGYKERKFSTKIPNGESWNDVKKRMLGFIKDIDKKYKNKKILIVSHGDPLWILKGIAQGLTEKKFLNQLFIYTDYVKVGQLIKIN